MSSNGLVDLWFRACEASSGQYKAHLRRLFTIKSINSTINNFYQDRDKMESGASWTGLPLFLPEDIAITTSMRPICDRTKENLVSADVAIAGMRKVLRDCAAQVNAGKSPRSHKWSQRKDICYRSRHGRR